MCYDFDLLCFLRGSTVNVFVRTKMKALYMGEKQQGECSVANVFAYAFYGLVVLGLCHSPSPHLGLCRSPSPHPHPTQLLCAFRFVDSRTYLIYKSTVTQVGLEITHRGNVPYCYYLPGVGLVLFE